MSSQTSTHEHASLAWCLSSIHHNCPLFGNDSAAEDLTIDSTAEDITTVVGYGTNVHQLAAGAVGPGADTEMPGLEVRCR